MATNRNKWFTPDYGYLVSMGLEPVLHCRAYERHILDRTLKGIYYKQMTGSR